MAAIEKNIGGVSEYNTDNNSSYYVVLDNGLIINWGQGGNSSGSMTSHYFGYPFTTIPEVVCTGIIGSTDTSAGRVITIGNTTTTYFTTVAKTSSNGNAATGFHWIAIGT